MSARATTTSYGWSRSAVPALRRWILIPLLLALLGALAGALVSGASRSSAEALLLVQSDAADAAGMQRAAADAAIELDTPQIYQAATKESGADPADLQLRTTVSTKPNSQVVSIKVAAPTSAQAVRDANAVANAGMNAGPDRVPDALEQLTDSMRDLINSESLSNDSAERARVARLGDELAAGQAALVTDANRLQLLQVAQPNTDLPSAPLLGLLGAVAGALLGAALALLLGARRGTVKSEHELAALYPDAEVVGTSDLQDALSVSPSTTTVIVARSKGTRPSAVSETIRDALGAATGKEVVVADSFAAVPVNGSPNGHINLVTTRLSESVLRRARRDESALLIVPVQPGATRLDEVDSVASRLPDRAYLLVENESVAWS